MHYAKKKFPADGSDILLPLIHFYMWGFAAKTASAFHIDGKLWRAAVLAWRAFLTTFLTLPCVHKYM